MKETPSEGTGVRGVLPFNVFIYPVVKTTRRLSWHRWLLNVIKKSIYLNVLSTFPFYDYQMRTMDWSLYSTVYGPNYSLWT